MSIDITFDSLIGEHVLDGVDTATESVKREWGDEFEDCAIIRFRLDGVVYCGIEDPNDGYRSSMRHIRTSDAPITNVFPPIRVLAMKKPSGGSYGRVDDTLMLVDLVTGKPVVEVGTDNTDDYYPSFVGTFSPENMVTNVDKATGS